MAAKSLRSASRLHLLMASLKLCSMWRPPGVCSPLVRLLALMTGVVWSPVCVQPQALLHVLVVMDAS